MLKIGNALYKSGDVVFFQYQDGRSGMGKISFDESSVADYQRSYSYVPVWLCTNNHDLSGEYCSKRYGFEYSWALRVENGTNTFHDDSVRTITPFVENLKMKQGVHTSEELIQFLSLNDLTDFTQPIFEFELGIFDEFNQYEVSPNSGFILLKNNKKNMEIKMGRFIRQMALKFNELIAGSVIQKLEITDKLIEAIHNKYVSFQQGDSCMIQFLQGDDIDKGYTRENYLHTTGGTLHNSCMTDKLHYIEIYKKNPNQIKLAVIYIGDKVAARTIVWTAIDGKQYSDRVYYKYDWLDNFMKEKLRKDGIEPIDEKGIRVVQLEKWEFSYYPYADSFYHMDRNTGTIVSLCNASSLRNTNGRIG